MYYYLVIFFFCILQLSLAEVEEYKSDIDFWKLKGEYVFHPIVDSADFLSDQRIVELRGADGIPVWFARHFDRIVCFTGKCKMIRLWLFWDGAGNYLGIETDKDEPLTKTDHSKFTIADYQKLEEILKDTTSVFGRLTQEQLIVVPDSVKNPYEIDGYTAATQPAVKDVVVKNAVFTCHTLWHTVYGNTQQEIESLLESRTDSVFLDRLLSNPNSAYVIWAIAYLRKHPSFSTEFHLRILDKITSENLQVSDVAFAFFHSEQLKNKELQLALVQHLSNWEANKKKEFLWWLDELKADQPIDDQVVVQLLHSFQAGELGIGSLNLILQLIDPQQIYTNPEIRKSLDEISASDQAYVRNMTQRFMKNLILESTTKH